MIKYPKLIKTATEKLANVREDVKATETEVVNPYDNSIKTQGTEKELTLFTCSQKGTMRFVVRCIYKEAVMDE